MRGKNSSYARKHKHDISYHIYMRSSCNPRSYLLRGIHETYLLRGIHGDDKVSVESTEITKHSLRIKLERVDTPKTRRKVEAAIK